MKRISPNYSKNYSPLILWLEDLEAIEELLKPTGSVKIETANYEFDSIDEMAKYFGTRSPRDLEIKSQSKPYASVDLRHWRGRLYISESQDAAKVFHEIDQLLVSRQRRFPLLYSDWILLSFGLVAPLTMFLHPIAALALAAIAFPLFFWWLYVPRYKHCVLILERRSASRTYLQRNRDTLINLIIGALIGAAITALGTQLIKIIPTNAPSVETTSPQSK